MKRCELGSVLSLPPCSNSVAATELRELTAMESVG